MCIATAISESMIRREDLVVETKCDETVNDDGALESCDWAQIILKRILN